MCAETNTALLTGIFALSGVALSQVTTALLSFLDKSHKRKVLLREKYEELGTSFLSSIEMPQKLLLYRGNTEAIHLLTHQTNANRMDLLALLYFPQLEGIIGQYTQSYSDLCIAVFSIYDSKDSRPIGVQVCQSPEYIQASNAHVAARDRLREELKTHSVTYTNV